MPSEPGRHLHVYGIKNCDSCRAALKWLQSRNAPHSFHDVRDGGLDRDTLSAWLSSSHAASLVNKRSTTWRKLSEREKQVAAAGDHSARLTLLLAHPTLIKRPVITDGYTILDIGFSSANMENFA